jgi:predicted alpha-1,2-mannosidase
LLGKIQVSGGSIDQQTEFYTALYHALLFPSVFSDDSGQYMGVNGTVQTVDSGHSAFYTNFSGWDIYRSQAQLEALLDPQVASDTAESMIDDYAQDGMLPKWMEENGESYIMVGDPADSILADYYAFGATNFDTSTALADMVAEATSASKIRPGLNYLNEPGYLPENGTYSCCNAYGPMSMTLEYDTADFAISALAGDLGQTSEQQEFLNRSQDWMNVLNPDSGFDQPRNANGTWTSGFSPTAGTGFVEADSWIYTGMVPYDLAGLAAAKGGNSVMARYLNTTLRSYTGTDGYADVGDEPSIELPWEYDYIGQPYKTQEAVRQIQDQIWTDTPSGLGDGNDDLGTMSAWFVWSALGMYPMTPGTPTLALGSPLFTQAVVTLPSGSTLTIDGNGAAATAAYVQSASWNGTAWDDAYAPAAAITSGGTLSYTLGTSPDTSWAAAATDAPPSYSGNTVAPPGPRVGPVTSGVRASLCLDDRLSSTTPGNPVQIYTCNGGDNQAWTRTPDGTISALGLCLDVHRDGKTSGTKIDLYTCNGTGAQQWRMVSGGTLVNPESGLCLDTPSASPGPQLELAACNGSSGESWTMPQVAAATRS